MQDIFSLTVCALFSQALRTTILHHLGTVAFGSLIIALIRTIRAVVSYFQRKLKKTHNKVRATTYALLSAQLCCRSMSQQLLQLKEVSYLCPCPQPQ